MNRRSIEDVMKKIIFFVEKRLSGEQLFLLAFLIYLAGEVLTTTMFPVPGIVSKLCRMIFLGLIAWKVLIFGSFQMNELMCVAILCVDVLLVRVFSGYSDPLMWTLLLVGAKDVSFEKILKIYFVVTSSIVVFAFIGSLLDVIVNLQYTALYAEEEKVIRNSFGIVYPTDFAAHIFFLMLVFLYLVQEKIKTVYYVICIGIACFVYSFCHTRLDFTCMCLLIIGHMILKKREKDCHTLKSKYRKSVWLEKYGMYSMPVTAIFITVITVLYNPQNVFMSQANIWLSSRLSMGKKGLTEYTVRAFGQYIEMVGNGGSTTLPAWKDYFFIDCSYLNILLRFGLVFLLIVLVAYVMCCRKYQKDCYFILTIAMISLNCMVAHHLTELAYNPFALALFAKMPMKMKENRRIGS